MVTELVSAVESSGTATVATMNEAGVLRDTMLLSVANEVTHAAEYVSTAGIVAGIWVGISARMSRCHSPGNGSRRRWSI
jgi:hypothetical protein